MPFFFFFLLQSNLPFKSKPKNQGKGHGSVAKKRQAVVLEPGEKRNYTIMQQLSTIGKDKEKKRKIKNKEKYLLRMKKKEKEAAFFAPQKAEERKRKFRKAVRRSIGRIDGSKRGLASYDTRFI